MGKATQLNWLRGTILKGMFVVSYGLALSVMLSACEDEIEKLVRETAGFPDDLATKGETALTHAQATKLYGRLLAIHFKRICRLKFKQHPDTFGPILNLKLDTTQRCALWMCPGASRVLIVKWSS